MASPTKSTKLKGGKPCVFCLENSIDDDLYGKLMTKAGVTAHYFCMLFSSGLSQNGKSEKQGILGFLPSDIQKEVRRATRLRCVYCKKSGATIGCVTKNCKKSFHFTCGRRNDTLHQFFDTFCSFCPVHRPVQKVAASDDPTVTCAICMAHVKPVPSVTTLQAPCCKKYWYHRECIQRYSNSAGLYFFKCPMCNNKDDFQRTMLTFGIYIPDQDASWETEPHAFQDLLERYRNCDANSCKCLEGRKYDEEGTKWEIILCEHCGSQGSHIACSFLVKVRKKSVCPSCYTVEQKVCEEKKMKSPNRIKSPKSPNVEDTCSPEGQKSPGSGYPGPSYKPKKRGLPGKNLSSPDIACPVLSPPNVQRMKMPSKRKVSLESKKRGKRLSLVSPDRTTSPAKRRKTKCETQTYSKSMEASSKRLNGEDKENDIAKMKRKKKKSHRMSDISDIKSKSNVDQYKLHLAGHFKSKYKDSISPNGTVRVKRSYKKRLSSENDKGQTAITDWFRAKSAKDNSPTKTSVIKWFKRRSTALDNLCSKDIPEPVSYQGKKSAGSSKSSLGRSKISPIKNPSSIYSSPSKRSRQIRTVEWKGKQLVIKSPRVMLRKDISLCRMKPRQLYIDMNDRKGNPADQEFLNIINTDVRLTRNMLQGAAGSMSSSSSTNSTSTQTHTSEAAAYSKSHRRQKRLSVNRTLKYSQEVNSKRRTDSDREQTSVRETENSDNPHDQVKVNSMTSDSFNVNASPTKTRVNYRMDLKQSPANKLRKCVTDIISDPQSLYYREMNDSPAKNLRKRNVCISLPSETDSHVFEEEQKTQKEVDIAEDQPKSTRRSLDMDNPTIEHLSSSEKVVPDSPIFRRSECQPSKYNSRSKPKLVENKTQEEETQTNETDMDLQVSQESDRETHSLSAHTSCMQHDTKQNNMIRRESTINRFKDRLLARRSLPVNFHKPHHTKLQQNRRSPKTRFEKMTALVTENDEISSQKDQENEEQNSNLPLRRSPRKQAKADEFTRLQDNVNLDHICSQENLDPQNRENVMPLSQLTHGPNTIHSQQTRHSFSGVPRRAEKGDNYITWTLPGTRQLNSEKYLPDLNDKVQDVDLKSKTAVLDELRPQYDTDDRLQGRQNSHLPLKKRQYLSTNVDVDSQIENFLGKSFSMFHSKPDNLMRSNSECSNTSSNSEVCNTALSLSPSYVTRFRRSHSRTDVQEISSASIKNLSSFPTENSLKPIDKDSNHLEYASDVIAMAEYYSSKRSPVKRTNIGRLSSEENGFFSIV